MMNSKRFFIVIYVNINDIPANETQHVFEQYKNIVKDSLTENDVVWILPRHEGKTEVELLNKPNLILGEEYKEIINDNIKQLEELLDGGTKDKETE